MVERIQSKRRRVMRDFIISELSAVTAPAQKHALAVLMKRDDNQESNMQFEKITRDEPLSFDSLEDAMNAIREREGCGTVAAMEKAARIPGLLESYQREGQEIAKAAAEAAAPRPVAKAVTDFSKRVTEIMARDKVNKLAALEQAAREFPAEFSAYQES